MASENEVHILYPEDKFVSPETLIGWAHDEVLNGEHCGPHPENLEEAMSILEETGAVTFTKEGRA